MPALDIDSLSDHDFEELVAQLFTKMGFVIAAPTGGPDAGFDFAAYSPAAIVGGKYLVLCKRHAGPIEESAVRQLHALIGTECAVKGIFVTTSAFTPASKEFAADKSLELIDGAKMRELLAAHMPDALPPSENPPAWRLPPHFDPLCRQANALLSPIWREWDALRHGHVQVPQGGASEAQRFAADVKKYLDIVTAQSYELGEIVGTLAEVLQQQMSSKNETDAVLAAKKFAERVRRILDLRRNATEVQPPNGFADIHAALLAAQDDLLSAARRFHQDMIALRENPTAAIDAEGRATLTMDFTSPGVNRLSTLMNEMKAQLDQQQAPKCAVATACFGDAAAPEVLQLRRWRDEVLSRTRRGRIACRLYAVTSPPIAALFRRSPALAVLGRAVVRRVVTRLR